jgi:hypothetical protein
VLIAAGHGPRRTAAIVAAQGDIPIVDGIRRHKHLHRQCLACVESEGEVRRCKIIDCSIWPYRLGFNPHDPRRGKVPASFLARMAIAAEKPPVRVNISSESGSALPGVALEVGPR